MTESQLKKMIKSVTIGAVAVFCIMLIVIVGLLFKRGAEARNLKNLNAELESKNKKIETLNDELAYRNSLEYIEKYAREQLGMLKKSEKKYIPK